MLKGLTAEWSWIMVQDNQKKKVISFSRSKVIEAPKVIRISKRIVQFGSEIYQFHNVTGFGFSKIPDKRNFSLIYFAFFSLLIGFFIKDLRTTPLGISIILSSFLLLMISLFPSAYVFKIYLNSGDSMSFFTRDRVGIKRVVYELRQFMQSDKEGNYEIRITSHSINIHQKGSFGLGVAINEITDFVGNKMNNLGVIAKEICEDFLEVWDEIGRFILGELHPFFYLFFQDLIILSIVSYLLKLIAITVLDINWIDINVYLKRLFLTQHIVLLEQLFFWLIGIVILGRIIGRIWVDWQKLINRRLSLYEQAKRGVHSLTTQFFFCSLLFTLLFLLSFIVGVEIKGIAILIILLGFSLVASSERQRFMKLTEKKSDEGFSMSEKERSMNPKISVTQTGPIGVGVTENVYTKQVGGIIHNYAPEQKQNLAKAAAEIQQLLKQLEENYPTATEPEKQSVLAVAIQQEIKRNPTFKVRLRNALKEGGIEALKVLFAPIGIPIEMVKGWIEAEAE
jgi:hypothetical protein